MRIHTNRRPRFGDVVLLGPSQYTVAATAVAPTKGYWVRRAGALDADGDRFLTLAEWAALAWDTATERWAAA